jgi:hypothetical protein
MAVRDLVVLTLLGVTWLVLVLVFVGAAAQGPFGDPSGRCAGGSCPEHRSVPPTPRLVVLRTPTP